MKKFAHLTVAALTGAIVVVILGGVLAPWAPGQTVFGADVPVLMQTLLEETFRGEALDTRDNRVVHCLEGKNEVVEGLVEGKLTLPEAVERFRALTALLDDGQDDVLGAYQGPREQEELVRNVLDWVDQRLKDNPRRGEVLARLHAEMRGYGAEHRRQG